MNWVYGVVQIPWDQGSELLILPRIVAEQQAHWTKVLSCGTWGELREVATADEYAEVLERAGHGSFKGFTEHLSTGMPIPGSANLAMEAFDARGSAPPDDDQDFLPGEDIPSYADGDFPPDVHYLMNIHLPADVVATYGETYETVFNGTYARFVPGAMPGVVAALEQGGSSWNRTPPFSQKRWSRWRTHLIDGRVYDFVLPEMATTGIVLCREDIRSYRHRGWADSTGSLRWCLNECWRCQLQPHSAQFGDSATVRGARH